MDESATPASSLDVVICDPSPIFRELLCQLFSPPGCVLRVFKLPCMALTAIRQQPPDLVLISLEMPDIDGIEFTRLLRQEMHLAQITVLMLTSSLDQQRLNQALSIGVTEIMSKHAPQSIALRVEELISARSRQGVEGRILYVEDSRAESELVIQVLQHMSLDVCHVTRAEDALAQLQSTAPFDLVVTDLVLAGELNGADLFYAIKRLSAPLNRLPVLILTALDDQARRIELLRSGIADYVSKPLIVEELRVRVANLLRAKKLSDQVDSQARRLKQLAMTDHLTGLLNRHSLAELAPRLVAQNNRHGTPVSTMMIDVDHFKRINDSHGHHTGDLVLQAVAAILQDSCRADDLLARFGGEEFVYVLGNCDKPAARVKAESLRRNLEQASPQGISVTASFGISGGVHTDSLEVLLQQADQAVYLAKHRGRNRICDFSECAGHDPEHDSKHDPEHDIEALDPT